MSDELDIINKYLVKELNILDDVREWIVYTTSRVEAKKLVRIIEKRNISDLVLDVELLEFNTKEKYIKNVIKK